MSDTLERHVHLVGSLPFDDEAEAMRIAVEELGETLLSLPDGEVGRRSAEYPQGERSAWTAIVGAQCAQDTELWQITRDVVKNAAGFPEDYDHCPQLRPRCSPRELSKHLQLHWNTHAKESCLQFAKLKNTRSHSALRFQVGLPTALGITFTMMSPLNALRYEPAFRERLAYEANDILKSVGADQLLLQLELPAELALAYRLPGPLVGIAVRPVLKLLEQIDSGAPIGLHICFGDLNNKALIKAPQLHKLVHFTNRLVSQWPEKHRLELIHLPLAEAAEPPTLEPSWYEPLSKLRVPPETRIVAGCVHEKCSDGELRQIIQLVESRLGRAVDVASSCGLGRRDRNTALQMMGAMRRLAVAH